MRSVAVAGWLVIVAALLAWQAVGLVRGPEWPTLSDLLRAFIRPAPGRLLLFGLWLWLGWHLFVAGSGPLLRG